MNSLRSILISAYLVGFSGALVPGPMFMATVAYVPQYGAWSGPLVVLGHGITEAAVIAALVGGLGKWLSQERVLAWIGLLGGAALIAFGVLTLMASRSVSLASGHAAVQSLHPVVAGVVTAVVNPYWLFWWATIGVSYVGLSMQRGYPGLATFGFGHIMADFVWFTLVSTVLAFGRSLVGDTPFRFIVAGCGAGLVAFGVRFAWSGVRRWSGKAAEATVAGDVAR